MKILILRFSSIGDIVLTTPVIRCIKTQFPNYKVHYATKKQFENLLITNPYIDKLHLLDKDIKLLIKELKAENFDLIIDLHNNLRTKIIWLNLRIKRYAFDKINLEKWLYVNFKIDWLPHVHIVDRYMTTVAPLGVKNDGKGLDFFINENTSLQNIEIPQSYLVYAIGGQHATKKLPQNKQIELANSIKENIVLIGGKEDETDGEKLAEQCPSVLNLCGKLSIHQSALLMQNALKIYTHDTGMMHIAAALQKPIVSIWGNTTPRFGMYPYYGIINEELIMKNDELGMNNEELRMNNFKEINNLSCRPCGKIGFNQCPKGHFKCMEEQVF